MIYFLLNIILWTLALYGLIEIIKTVVYSYTYSSRGINDSDGIYLIIATKNQEENIEGFLRSDLLNTLYGNNDKDNLKDLSYIKDILVVDLNSEDKTKEILEKISKENPRIKVIDWDVVSGDVDGDSFYG
ncbi:MAG: glycosyltransferase [Clostridia bacterium]|nr:glycosyltransferase [Clostridia bacterium]